MPIILDTNCFPEVFSATEYAPIKKWIIEWPWMIVYWWDKFIWELKQSERVLTLLGNFSKLGKVIKCPSIDVDNEQSKIEVIVTDPDFDDPHIIALAKVSKTLLVATKDKRSIRFVTDSSFYWSSKLTPKIYSWLSNAVLLSKKYIHKSNKDKCKTLKKTERPNI